jgi:trans-aconitate 2-methyltransferase
MSTMRWNVPQYEKFAGERARPFFDLVGRVPDGKVDSVVDLGCGTGELTLALAERWPDAHVLGVDNSPDMLAAARPRAIPGRLQFEPGDAGRFRPAPVDRLISNAVLHWIPNHHELFPRLAAAIAPGGALAVQMPTNHDAPSHMVLRQVAAEGPWVAKLEGKVQRIYVQPLAFYARILLELGFTVDAWETTYLHILSGPDPVLQWVKGTTLRPVLAALDATETEAYLARCAVELAAAYPPGPDGRTLFPFRRLFVVAQRPAPLG